MVSSPLNDLEPRWLWKRFDEIRSIPHPSGQEEALREHIKGFAKRHSLEVRQDAAGNICVVVPATPGHELAPVVVLQGHMDMVCEKNSDTEFDFTKDPIKVRVEGDWVHALGTTLGADNGIGVAAALAVVDDESVVHGPLELLLTVDEETGLTGAMGLDPALITGRRLINLDSEDDGVIFVGCAGGRNVSLTLPVETTAAPQWPAINIQVRGLRGGHSGLDIDKNRANALKVLALALNGLRQSFDLPLAFIEGGSAHNAIAREAHALCLHPPGTFDEVKEIIESAYHQAQEQWGQVEKELTLHFSQADRPSQVMTPATSQRIVDLLLALPHGPQAMSHDIPGLVETSNNLATVTTDKEGVKLLLSARSSAAAALELTVSQLQAIGALAGAEVTAHDGYPGWQPDMDSAMLAVAREVFSDIWGKAPKVTAIHAGLECGLIGDKVPGIDMVSFGPELESVHSPEERVQISSTARFWEALKHMLQKLS